MFYVTSASFRYPHTNSLKFSLVQLRCCCASASDLFELKRAKQSIFVVSDLHGNNSTENLLNNPQQQQHEYKNVHQMHPIPTSAATGEVHYPQQTTKNMTNSYTTTAAAASASIPTATPPPSMYDHHRCRH